METPMQHQPATIRRPARLAILSGGLAATLACAACAPTIHVKVDPITIYAKLDANVRLRLDEDVKALIQKNPNLF
jgi:hypothetical protein